MTDHDDTPSAPVPWSGLLTRAGLPSDFLTRSGSGRLKALLDLRDPGQVLRRLRADEAFFLLAGIGLEDAAPLLPYMTPTERLVLADLQAWTGPHFVPDRLDEVIELAMDVSRDFALRWLSELPPEVIALRIARATTEILTSDELEGHVLPDAGVVPSPDGVFTLVLADAEEVPVVRRWIDLLWSWDLEEAHRLLQSLRRELPSALEEEARRLREARLQDWGFPALEDRFSLYEPLDRNTWVARLQTEVPESLPSSDDEDRALGLVWSPEVPSGPLGRLLSRMEDPRRLAWFVSQTTFLVNRALGALEEDWSRPEARARAAAHVLRWMSIGAEVLGGSGGISPDLLARRIHPTDLFRAGIEAIRPGQVLARQVVGRLGGLSRVRLLEDVVAAQVEALAGFPPRVASPLPPHEPRDPDRLSEVQEACRMAREADAVTRFAIEALGYDPTGPAPDLRSGSIASVLATAWAWGVLTGETSLRPLSREDVRRLRLAAFEGSRIRPSLRHPAQAAPQDPGDPEQAVRRMIGRSLDRVEEVLGGLDPAQEPDLQFLGDVLLFQDAEPPTGPGPAGTRDGDSE